MTRPMESVLVLGAPSIRRSSLFWVHASRESKAELMQIHLQKGAPLNEFGTDGPAFEKASAYIGLEIFCLST